MMKTNELFDRMLYDMEQLDEGTIVDTETDHPENIIALVKQRMAEDTQKPARKRSRKKAVISLIAAALVSVVIGTTAIATGLFRTVFDGKIIDENPNASVVNVPINFESDDVDMVCNGISSDPHNVFASFIITKKDGSSFVENADDMFIPHNSWEEEPGEQSVRCPTAVISDTKYSYSGYIDYRFKDEKTLEAFLSYNCHGYDISGKPITMKEGKIYAYRIKDIIYQAEGESTPDGGHFYNYKENKQMLDQIAEEYRPKLKEGEAIRFYDEELALCVVDRVELKMNFTGSFTVDTDAVSRKLIDTPTKVSLNDKPCTLTEITAENYLLQIKADCSEDKELGRYFATNLTVELKDGTVITAEMRSYGAVNDSSPEQGMVTATYMFADRNEEFQFINVDPDDIVSIYSRGEKLYG